MKNPAAVGLFRCLARVAGFEMMSGLLEGNANGQDI
jgi:hypothetical protein